MNKNRIIQNLLILATGQAATFGLSFGYVILVSRYLGPTGFGELTLAKTIVVVGWLCAQLGMTTLITRTVARSPERAGVVVSAAMVLRTALSIPVFGAIIAYTLFAHLNTETRLAVYFYGAAEILWSLQAVMIAAFQGRENMSLGVAWSVAVRMSGLALGLLVMWRHGGVVAFAATDLPVAVVLLCVTLYWMRGFGGFTWRVSRSVLGEVFIGGVPFWANDLLLSIYMYIDSIILASLAGTRAVGIYRSPTQIFTTAMLFPGIIGSATLPILSRLGVDAAHDFRRATRKTLSYFIVAAVPLTVLMATFASPMILTAFGPQYRPAIPVLVVLSLCILPAFANFQFGQTFTASDRQWHWSGIMGAMCVVNPVVNVVMIPLAIQTWHNGALGAALSLLLTELIQVTFVGFLLHDLVVNRPLGRVLAVSLAAGALQLSLILGTAGLWSPVGQVVGAIGYAAVLIALRALPTSDVLLLREMALARVPGLRRILPAVFSS